MDKIRAKFNFDRGVEASNVIIVPKCNKGLTCNNLTLNVIKVLSVINFSPKCNKGPNLINFNPKCIKGPKCIKAWLVW